MDPCGKLVRSWVEMRVALTMPDFDEGVAFYRDALGLPKASRSCRPGAAATHGFVRRTACS
jgi:catechol 2,3-dioxygenase-like lactoylglutathione lyase family enzyme